jgi:two-component system, OmpR family, sensor histidine kinase KdpD
MTIRELLGPAAKSPKLLFFAQCSFGCLIVALLTWCGFGFLFIGAAIGFLYLPAVVSVSIERGFWAATVTSVVAVVCLDYFFYPPFFSLSIANPRDWVALAAFEVSAVIVSRLASKERRNYREVALQREALSKLYELSRSALLLDLRHAPGPQLSQIIHRIFGVKAVALFDANLGRLGTSFFLSIPVDARRQL